jgi:epoxyqueuosine reductase
MHTLEERLKEQARALGFDLAGIAAAGPADTYEHFRDWLDNGLAGEMDYLYRHAQARQHPSSILPEVRTVVMLGMSYHPRTCEQDTAGKVSCYAWGRDYHDVLRGKLNELLGWVQGQVPGCRGRGVVDTAPLLERDFARRAGLGWFGKNTMLLNKRHGSFFFLGALLLDIVLQPDPPHQGSHCGTCTACLDACPTGAFLGPGRLDSRRCLSYLTIELKGPVPEELRAEMTDWLFGCDVCQDVCPWNRKALPMTHAELGPRPDLLAVDLLELLTLTEEAFRERFRGTALMRTKRRGLLRNALLILGNRAGPEALPAVRRLREDPEPVLRDAARWAQERITARASKGPVPGP